MNSSTKCDKPSAICEFSNAMFGICEHERNGECELLLMGRMDDDEGGEPVEADNI